MQFSNLFQYFGSWTDRMMGQGGADGVKRYSRKTRNQLFQIRVSGYMKYGLWILTCLLIIGGLQAALTRREGGILGRMKNRGDMQKQDEAVRKAEEGNLDSKPDIVIDNPDIRVLIMTNGYANEVHPAVEAVAAGGLIISFGEENQEVEGGQPAVFAPDDQRFQSGQIRIRAKDGGEVTLSSVKRACGAPSYAGILELWTTAEGIAVVNELPVESYLCKVIPSEMPASYELEALKAQAVCARSFAYQQIQDYGYPEYEAHVNDSTDYQVYGNSQAQDGTNRAVEETKGQVVRYQDRIVTTYYYSTSCGRTAGLEAWGTKEDESNQYLRSVEVKDGEGDYESEMPWYRWEARIPAGTLSNLIGLNTGTDIGTVQSLEITNTGAGGVALQICAAGDKGSVTVDTENKIRRALGGGGYEITRQDGTKVSAQKLLPSAFFTVQKDGDLFVLSGGGYGHGIGMSQNGANEMAKKGKNYIEILSLFFQDVTIEAG